MSDNQEADLYSVLGASSCDSVQRIKQRYQQLVLQVNTDNLHLHQVGGSHSRTERVRACFQYHPDRFRGGSSSEAASALKKFLEIEAAWRTLRDQESRRQYDLKLRGGWSPPPKARSLLSHG